MPLDEQIRHSAEAFASDLGRDIQQKLDQFVEAVLGEAAAEREALMAQAAQFAADADAHLEAAVAQARTDAEAAAQAAVAQARADAEAGIAAAVAQALADTESQTAAAVAQARAEAAAEHEAVLARLHQSSQVEHAAAVERAREEAASEATAIVARARDEIANASALLQADQDARQAELDRATLERQRDEREAMLAEMERLVEGFRRLDGTASLSALLDALAAAAAEEAPRSALLLVRGRDVQGWSFTGFSDAPAEPRRLLVPLDPLSDLARVVETRRRAEVQPATFTSGEAAPFAFAAPREGDVGVAVPVTVGGEVAAILYADDGGEAERMAPASWPETLELLARHAARCLEAQTAIRASRLGVSTAHAGAAGAAAGEPQGSDSQGEAAARRYARLVVSDLRLTNEPAVLLGREQRNLGDRLRTEIERARQTYLERVPADVTSRERLFDEELVRTLADGDASLLGSLPAAAFS